MVFRGKSSAVDVNAQGIGLRLCYSLSLTSIFQLWPVIINLPKRDLSALSIMVLPWDGTAVFLLSDVNIFSFSTSQSHKTSSWEGSFEAFPPWIAVILVLKSHRREVSLQELLSLLRCCWDAVEVLVSYEWIIPALDEGFNCQYLLFIFRHSRWLHLIMVKLRSLCLY